jgi:hypothetical protein
MAKPPKKTREWLNPRKTKASFVERVNAWPNKLPFVNLTVKAMDPVGNTIKLGRAKANGREPKSCLDRVFNFRLGSF